MSLFNDSIAHVVKKSLLAVLLFCSVWICGYKLTPRIKQCLLPSTSEYERLIAFCDKFEGAPLSQSSDAWYAQPQPLIWAHAGGARLGIYSNSKEAIDDAIESGFKVIEIDVSLTSDGVLVLSHDFRPNLECIYKTNPPKLEEFKTTKINDCLTPLTWEEFVAQYSSRDEDVWYIIDPKENLGDFDFVQYAKSNIPKDFIRRCAYQVYGIDELSKFKDGSPFGSLHYCLDYFNKDGQRFEDIMALLPIWPKMGVHSVSFGDNNERTERLKSIVKKIRDAGIHVSVFGVNSEANYLSWKDFGVDCINSDYLYPAATSSGVINIKAINK